MDAVHAAALAPPVDHLNGSRDLVRYDDQTVLLLPHTTADATLLVSRVLGELIQHDSERGTQYLNTLRVMLRVDRVLAAGRGRTAHPQADARLPVKGIEQLTGRGLTKTEHFAELWIALQSYDLLIGHATGTTR